MSRIAGLMTSDVKPRREELVEGMLRCQTGFGWRSEKQGANGITAGWTGWDSPCSATRCEWTVVVDGAFFNRDELPRGSNDAERIIYLIEQVGFARAVSSINGDFAIAAFNERTQTLHLARDRVGAKPLFYCDCKDGFAFSSRARGLLTLPSVPASLNPQFVAIFAGSHYRYFDNDPGSSPYQVVKQLPAGCLLTVKRGESPQIDRYWSLEDLPNWTADENELAVQYRELLIDAVKRRYDVATSPAFTLSGGMDSSSVLACAVNASGKKQHAFSTVYADKTYDESDEIQSMLEQTVEHWHPVALDQPNVLETVRKMVSVHDEPVATATWLSHYLLCEHVSKLGFGSLFGGLGGDELNAGEYEYFLYHFADLLADNREPQLKTEIDRWIEYHDHPIFKKSHELADRELARLVKPGRRGQCAVETNRLTRYFDAVNPDYYSLAKFEPQMDHPFSSYLKNRTYQDMFRETAPCCLRAEDRQATAFGLENYLPFFDHRLIEFMYRVPGEMKIRGGVTKILLRNAMQGVLPDETRQRIKKTGWNAPAHVWFSGAGREPLMDLVRSQTFRERGLYDLEKVDQIVEEHEQIMSEQRQVENHMMFLWQLVNLEIWMREVDRLSIEKGLREFTLAG